MVTTTALLLEKILGKNEARKNASSIWQIDKFWEKWRAIGFKIAYKVHTVFCHFYFQSSNIHPYLHFFLRLDFFSSRFLLNNVWFKKTHTQRSSVSLLNWVSVVLNQTLKFIYFEKATNICEISTLLLSYVEPFKSKVKISQKDLGQKMTPGYFNQILSFESRKWSPV